MVGRMSRCGSEGKHLLLRPLSRGHARLLFELLLEVAAVVEAAGLGNGLVGPVGVLADDALCFVDAQVGEPVPEVQALMTQPLAQQIDRHTHLVGYQRLKNS